MISTYYECNISYFNEVEGKEKKITESVMVDALSFAEAEEKCMAGMGMFDGLVIKGIKRSSFAEILLVNDNEIDKFYKGKVKFLTLDEKSGKEKQKTFYYLIQAESTFSAMKTLQEKIVDTSQTYAEITGVTDCNIADVIKDGHMDFAGSDDEVKVECGDCYGYVKMSVMKSGENFSITFQEGEVLTFKHEEQEIVCIDAQNCNPDNMPFGYNKEDYIGKQLKYSK